MSRWRNNETGSALMLAPAGVLVLLILGAISVDSAIAFSAQRELTNQATAAVNDAVTLSLTDEELQQGSGAQIDSSLAARIVRDRLLLASNDGLIVNPDRIFVDVNPGGGSIAVRAEADAPYIFSSAIPGARDHAHVIVSVGADLRRRGAS